MPGIRGWKEAEPGAVPGSCWNQDTKTPGARLEKPLDVTGWGRKPGKIQFPAQINPDREGGSGAFPDPPRSWIRRVPGSAASSTRPNGTSPDPQMGKRDPELFPVFPALPRDVVAASRGYKSRREQPEEGWELG